MSQDQGPEQKEQAAGEGKGPQFRVDEGWKQRVAEERERLKEQGRAEAASRPKSYPKPDVRVFFAGLYTQTLMCLGEIENPATKQKEADLPEAEYLIDTIDMLRQKMQGNLSADEQQYLDGLLHDLRMRYVGAAARPAPQAQGTAGQGKAQ